MRVVLYCQHVLGIGHFFRSLEIARALSPHRVDFITGGEEVDTPLPPHVRHLPLPPLRMDADFKDLLPGGQGGEVGDILARRRDILLEHLAGAEPDVFLVELFPFGRKKFGVELLPVLEHVRSRSKGRCRIVCSLRDILVEKADQDGYERGVLKRLNGLFDAVLVHADPSLIRLEETFSRVGEIEPEIRYTGYVASGGDPLESKVLRHQLIRENRLGPDQLLVTASAGGGAVGGELLESVVRASAFMAEDHPHFLQVFTGPFMEPQAFDRLGQLADPHGHIRVERFTDRHPVWLGASDLSVSLAGYNTTMNLLAAKTYGLVLPFARNREQAMRAARLEERGGLGVLAPDDLVPEVLARKMESALAREASDPRVDLGGAASTAAILAELAAS